jgi:hypothetical protein
MFHRVDGNQVKRLVSGGDEIEVRTNHKDEVRKKLQATVFLFNNDFPKVEPADAYQTLDVFGFDSAFVSAVEIQARGDKCPKHWKPADPDIKRRIRDPDVIDAFTMLVLEAYTKEMLVPPECVSIHTKKFTGAASVRDIDRIAEVVKYDPNPNSKVFLEEMKLALENAGMQGISTYQISQYVDKLYGAETSKPEYKQIRKLGKKAYGYSHIRLEDVVAFNEVDERRAANLRKSEAVRQQVRNEGIELGKRTFDEMD